MIAPEKCGKVLRVKECPQEDLGKKCKSEEMPIKKVKKRPGTFLHFLL